eukprot:7551448-Karenia_brevis.AAC.1
MSTDMLTTCWVVGADTQPTSTEFQTKHGRILVNPEVRDSRRRARSTAPKKNTPKNEKRSRNAIEQQLE